MRILVLLLWLWPVTGLAATIEGRVVHGDASVPGVVVAAYRTLDFTGQAVATALPSDAEGQYRINLPAGSYALAGWNAERSLFAVCGRNPVNLVDPDGLQVRGRRVGFAQVRPGLSGLARAHIETTRTSFFFTSELETEGTEVISGVHGRRTAQEVAEWAETHNLTLYEVTPEALRQYDWALANLPTLEGPQPVPRPDGGEGRGDQGGGEGGGSGNTGRPDSPRR